MPVAEGRPARRLETRLLIIDRRGSGYGVTYKWRADGSEADLLTEGVTEEIELKDRKQTWSFPSRSDCLVCHTTGAGFVLGVNTRQLNHPIADSDAKEANNLLRRWNRLGLFQPAIRDEDIPRFDRLAAVTDSDAAVELRARSYLDANCAQCHRPGGTRADFDARFDAARQKLVNAPLLSSDLGVSGVKLVTPGDPDRSMVYLRMKRRLDVFNMPPLATHQSDTVALAVVREWIKGLPTDATAPKAAEPERATKVAIERDKFLINGQPTYKGRTWNGKPVEGLLFNSRMVQAIFDDSNPETRDRWAYADTKKWDPDRNTR
jgi:hypothetical protein